MKRLIIIGGTAAGMTAASNLNRKAKGKISFTVYEKRPYASLGACGIPFFVGDKAKNYKTLIEPSVEEHISKGIDLKVEHEVTSVDFKKKIVKVKNLKTNQEFEDKYDLLFIGTGAAPIKPEFANKKIKNVHYATTLEDAKSIKKLIKDKVNKNITIIGGGFIGVELAENISHMGKKATIIEASSGLLSRNADKEISDDFTSRVGKKIKLRLNEMVESLEQKNGSIIVKTNKEQIKTDAVIVAIGFRPNTDIFKGIKKLKNGAIIINDYGQTSIKGVYAAGDCATVKHRVTNDITYIPLATTSRKIAKAAAFNLIGEKTKFPGTLGTSGVRYDNFELFMSGVTEAQAKEAGLKPISVTIENGDSASYAGERRPLKLKLIATEQGTLIGAQAIGENKSAALRIAALSAAIWNKMDVRELADFDLFYTPPFSTATDIIHIAAAQISKKVKTK